MFRYSPKLRASIGKYASSNGVAAAAHYFSRKTGEKISESTVCSMREAHLEELSKNRENTVVYLKEKKRGRRVILGEKLDDMVQTYLRKVRDGGGAVTSSIAIAAARGLILSHNKNLLVEFGGHVQLTRDWAYSLLSRMKFVKRKCTTAKSKQSTTEFERLKKNFLDQLKTTVIMEGIPIELILNWDQTGIKIVPSSLWTMDSGGSKWVEIIGGSDKCQIAALFCCSLVGDFLPIQVIYKGKTSRCHPKFKFPSD